MKVNELIKALADYPPEQELVGVASMEGVTVRFVLHELAKREERDYLEGQEVPLFISRRC